MGGRIVLSVGLLCALFACSKDVGPDAGRGGSSAGGGSGGASDGVAGSGGRGGAGGSSASGGSGSGSGGVPATGGAGAPSGGTAGMNTGVGGASNDGSLDTPQDVATAPDRGSSEADAVAAVCTTSGNTLCEDFETGKLDLQRWKLNKPTASASVTVDDTRVHTGKYALHIKVVPNQQSTAMITESVTFPGPKNAFYARMYINFGPEIPTAAMADFHTGFLLGVGNNDRGTVQAGVGMIGSAKQWLGYSIFFGNPKLEFGPWSKTLITANKWQCVELFEDGSNPATEVRQIWVDDVELADLRSDSAKASNGNTNHLPPKFDGVTFGLIEYHPIPTLSDVWIDDIRVAPTRIGCQ